MVFGGVNASNKGHYRLQSRPAPLAQCWKIYRQNGIICVPIVHEIFFLSGVICHLMSFCYLMQLLHSTCSKRASYSMDILLFQ